MSLTRWAIALAGTGGKSNGPSLTRLQDAVEMSQLFFTQSVEYSEEAAS